MFLTSTSAPEQLLLLVWSYATFIRSVMTNVLRSLWASFVLMFDFVKLNFMLWQFLWTLLCQVLRISAIVVRGLVRKVIAVNVQIVSNVFKLFMVCIQVSGADLASLGTSKEGGVGSTERTRTRAKKDFDIVFSHGSSLYLHRAEYDPARCPGHRCSYRFEFIPCVHANGISGICDNRQSG